ncbi:monovalent cation/H+ antiporter subunit F [Synergistales bacterium]|nr:monovalent cation/H+ antiporter subunit F [Synergistales bacterium]
MNLSQCFFIGTAFIMGVLMVALIPRLISGPTTADRLVAQDVINTLVSGIMLLLGAAYDSVVMVDVAIVYMALSFVSGLYFARHLEGGM